MIQRQGTNNGDAALRGFSQGSALSKPLFDPKVMAATGGASAIVGGAITAGATINSMVEARDERKAANDYNILANRQNKAEQLNSNLDFNQPIITPAQARKGIKLSKNSKFKEPIKIEHGEIHVDKNMNIKRVGKGSHDNGTDETVLLAKGDAVFPTQDEDDRTRLLNKIKAYKAGNSVAGKQLEKERDGLPDVDEAKGKAGKGVFDPPIPFEDNSLKQGFPGTYQSKFSPKRNDISPTPSPLPNFPVIESKRPIPQIKDTYEPSEKDILNTNEWNGPTDEVKTPTEEKLYNKRLEATNIKTDLNKAGEKADFKRANWAGGTGKGATSFDMSKAGDIAGNVISGVGEAANILHNISRSKQAIQPVQENYVKPERIKTVDTTQAQRNENIAMTNAALLASGGSTSRGVAAGKSAQISAQGIRGNNQIGSQFVDKQQNNHNINVQARNEAQAINAGKRDVYNDINAKRYGMKNQYKDAAMKEAAELSGKFVKRGYQQSLDAKADTMDRLKMDTLQTNDYGYVMGNDGLPMKGADGKYLRMINGKMYSATTINEGTSTDAKGNTSSRDGKTTTTKEG